MSDAGNYRPCLFNITCTASKIFEKLIFHVCSFLCTSCPLSFEQFVFQSSQGSSQQHLLYHDFNSMGNVSSSSIYFEIALSGFLISL